MRYALQETVQKFMAEGEYCMGNGKFETGSLTRGKELKGEILCKILSENKVMKGFQYKVGMNVDVNALALKGDYGTGLHFCFVRDICNYLDDGTKLALVSVPDGEDVYVGDGMFRTHRLKIKKLMPLHEVETWDYLYKNGADITVEDNVAIRWAVAKGYLEVVKYLHKNGADIMAGQNFTVRYAAFKSEAKRS